MKTCTDTRSNDWGTPAIRRPFVAPPRHVRYCRPRLSRLTDAQLYALLVRVQTLLLDRPHDHTALHVDVLQDDEERLLALYRVLPPAQRHEELARAERRVATARAALTAGTTGRRAHQRAPHGRPGPGSSRPAAALASKVQ